MGFFKKLFGLERDEQQEVKVGPDVKEEPVLESEPEPVLKPEPVVESAPIKQEAKELEPPLESNTITESIPEPSNDNTLKEESPIETAENNIDSEEESVETEVNFKNFFGVDLTNSPDASWDEKEFEFSSQGELIRNFHLGAIYTQHSYFSECNAKVIGKGWTNFFFEREFSMEKAMDIVFLIERDLFHNGNYKYLDCIDKYRSQLNDSTVRIEWKKDNVTISFSRDILTDNMQLGLWTPFYNKEYLDKTLNEDEETEIEESDDIASVKNFFGIDLKKSPNEEWKYVGLSNNQQIYELAGIDSDKYIFETCVANVDKTYLTEFYFSKPYNKTDAQKAVYLIEKGFGKNGIESFSKCNTHYASRIHNSQSLLEWNAKGCHISYIFMKDNETMNIIVKPTFYNKEFFDNNEKVYDDRIVTARGFNVVKDMKKFTASVESDVESIVFFVNEKWISDDQPILMASMLIDDELVAFNLDTNETYFKYSCPAIEQKFREGYNAVMLVTNYEFGDNNDFKVELYVQFVKSEDDTESEIEELPHGKVVKQYPITYELDYIDGQDHHQHKVIKNANMNSFVAGIKYRDNYEELLAKLEEGMELQIKPEPNNEFDPDALAVFNGEDHLGYIPKKDIPAVALNMVDGCTTAEIDYVDEEHVDLVIPVTFPGLETMSDEELEGFRYYKTERTKYETGYQENSSPITKEEFLEGIKQQRENL